MRQRSRPGTEAFLEQIKILKPKDKVPDPKESGVRAVA